MVVSWLRATNQPDAPKNGQTKAKVQGIQDKLSPTLRCFVLDQDSIEKYVPPDLYSKASLAKEEVLKRLGELRSKKREREEYKKEISTLIANVLSIEDLDKIPIIRDAVAMASSKAQEYDGQGRARS